MTIGDICKREVITASVDMDAQEAARLMREHHVGDLVVVEQRAGRNVPVGIVTDRDLVLEVLAQRVDPDSITLRDIMSESLQSAPDDDDLPNVLRLMSTEGVRRVVVTDQNGALVGIIALDDLVSEFSEQLALLSRLIEREQKAERLHRH